MGRFLLVFGVCLIIVTGHAWGADPTISPKFFKHDTQITVQYDVTGTTLANLTDAYAWVWIPGKDINAQYNINPATAAAMPARFTKSVADGKTLFTLVFKPSDFFTSSIASETTLGILLKGPSWTDGQTSDYLATFWDGTFDVKLIKPTQSPFFVAVGESIAIEAETPEAADFALRVNGVLIDSKTSLTNYTYLYPVISASGTTEVVIQATSGLNTEEVSFQYLVSLASPSAARPSGIIPGINYHAADPTKVTLCLWAPDKTSVYAFGDFTDWEVTSENLMNRDGEYFWLTLSGLTAGQEYAYQYLVNETLRLADPYADKILDPDDQYIAAATYPDLKAYPAKALQNEWYYNRVSTFQTNQVPYVWQVADFEKPAKSNLVVYELLLRDYFDSNHRNYQTLIDTLGYLKRLGINAIELMPIMEFNGNESWGYNPTFMFAPDKYYGTKNKFKEFVDRCHENGIAVILDIALNHQDLPNPYVLMDFDFSTSKPTPQNKWFNVSATHPYSVFFDMNHESTYTQAYLDTITHYWIHEFKVDGYRFDLSKGFTQTSNPDNVGAWGAYDGSRIAILKRMADKIWAHTPDAYVILEHFAQSQEEKELTEYKADQGKGMMVWGNLNYAYRQNAAGFTDGSDVSSIYHKNRGWGYPHIVGYMESHDEERMMYTNLKSGNSSGSYSVKNKNTALNRVQGAFVYFLTIPGPKMLWQFEELGYDYSINHCTNGSVSDACRLDPKPVKWTYKDESARQRVFDVVSDLNRLRKTYPVFSTGDATLFSGTASVKQLVLKSVPYTTTPVSANEMNVVVVVNFDVVEKTQNVSFPHTGTWFSYYGYGSSLTVTGNSVSMTLQPGEYKMFTDVQITNEIITDVVYEEEAEAGIRVFPNPTEGILSVASADEIQYLKLVSPNGMVYSPARLSADQWDIRTVAPGLYIVEVKKSQTTARVKIIKK